MKSAFAAAAFATVLSVAAPAGAQVYQSVEDDSLLVPPFNLTVDDIEDMDVLNANGEEIGEVDDVLMSNGEMTALSIEVGGVLGVGEKTVIVPIGQLSLSGDDLVTNMTQEELEALPEWEG